MEDRPDVSFLLAYLLSSHPPPPPPDPYPVGLVDPTAQRAHTPQAWLDPEMIHSVNQLLFWFHREERMQP